MNRGGHQGSVIVSWCRCKGESGGWRGGSYRWLCSGSARKVRRLQQRLGGRDTSRTLHTLEMDLWSLQRHRTSIQGHTVLSCWSMRGGGVRSEGVRGGGVRGGRLRL